MLYIVLILLVLLLVLLHVYFNCSEKARLFSKIPGPDYVFVMGNALEFLATPVKGFGLVRKCVSKWDRLFRFWAFNVCAINIYTADDVEMIISTTKHNSKSHIYDFMRPWLRDGLLVSNGQKWQQRRKILTPAFHFNILQKFSVAIEENSQRLVNTLDSSSEKETDVVPRMSEFTLNSICETAMGTRLSEEIADKGQSYKAAIHSIGMTIFQRITRIPLHAEWIFNLSSLGKTQRKYIDIVHGFTKKVIRERKEYIKQNGPEILVDDEQHDFMNNKKKRTAMLDLLISAQNDNMIDDDGIQEEVDTFMFEGHDTTASGLVYCLMLLANNRKIQENIFEELYTIFEDSERGASFEDLSKMRYLECCIKESLRLYPPVPFISRRLSDTVALGERWNDDLEYFLPGWSVGGLGLGTNGNVEGRPLPSSGTQCEYKIPKDTFCHVHIYDLHRRADLYPNPLQFDPDRFLPENCVGRHPYAYIPFSAGPRNCIGQKFAMMEMKFALCAILRRFELAPVTRPFDLHIAVDLVLRSTTPVYVTFIKRRLLKETTSSLKSNLEI